VLPSDLRLVEKEGKRRKTEEEGGNLVGERLQSYVI